MSHAPDRSAYPLDPENRNGVRDRFEDLPCGAGAVCRGSTRRLRTARPLRAAQGIRVHRAGDPLCGVASAPELSHRDKLYGLRHVPGGGGGSGDHPAPRGHLHPEPVHGILPRAARRRRHHGQLSRKAAVSGGPVHPAQGGLAPFGFHAGYPAAGGLLEPLSAL